MQRFILTIEGPGLEDVSEVELPHPPGEGEAIETRLGTCVITHVRETPAGSQYAGNILCRLP